MGPLCFVLMPFGTKSDGIKKEIDFDKVYNSFIKPAIIMAGLEPIRADEEKSGGFIHKPMYERLMFCDFAVADLSFANANVFYELGIRHALKPYTTVSIFETNTKLPFDTAALRTFPYNYEDGDVKDLQTKIASLAGLIKINLDVQKAQEDSPIGQLIQQYKFPDLNYLQKDADAFADKVIELKDQKQTLVDWVKQWKALDKTKSTDATDEDKNKIQNDQRAIVDSIVKIEKNEGDGLQYKYDLLYSIVDAYKCVNAFKEICAMLEPLVDGRYNENIYLKQQLGLAYNKTGNREDAEAILKTITDKYGPDPETTGLLGAVYKGLMDDNKNDADVSAVYRSQAVDTYVAGFESDPRDYYPGINAITLMYLGDVKDPRFDKFLPIVTYAIERQQKLKPNDYWTQASALEIAVLAFNEADARKYFAVAKTCNPEDWMKESTAGNLRKIYDKAIKTSDEQSLQWLKNILVGLDPGIFDGK
ncbi:MAG: TRAFs-binding domain-containing protein [Ginsengibacter sp.]